MVITSTKNKSHMRKKILLNVRSKVVECRKSFHSLSGENITRCTVIQAPCLKTCKKRKFVKRQ